MFSTLVKIRDLLKNRFGSKFRTFMIDNPPFVAESALPCVSISPVTTDISVTDTGRDSVNYTIEIRLIINAKTELQGMRDQMVGIQFLTETMEKRSLTGKLEKNTVLNVLREDLDFGPNWLIGNNASIDYTLQERGVQFFTKEAMLRLTIHRIANR